MSEPQPPTYGIRHRYTGLFWPAMIILVGVLALLVNTGIVSEERLYRLADLWPLLLVVLGLELLVSRAQLPATTATIAAALIVLLAVAGALAYVALGPAIPGGTHRLDVGAGVAAPGIELATIQIDVGSAEMTVSGSDSLHGDLYRAHIEYSGPRPHVSEDLATGHIEISQTSGFRLFSPQRFRMLLQLSSAVTWGISANSGAATESFNLSTVKLRSLDLATGASRADITLGAPSSTVPITISGGALTVHLHRPSGTSASVDVSGGAVSLDFDGRQVHAIGSASESSGPQAADTYRIQVNGGACTVTIDASA